MSTGPELPDDVGGGRVEQRRHMTCSGHDVVVAVLERRPAPQDGRAKLALPAPHPLGKIKHPPMPQRMLLPMVLST